MYYLKDDPNVWANLLPITFNRTVGSITLGATTILEKWIYYLEQNIHSIPCHDYLNFNESVQTSHDDCCIYSHFLPDDDLLAAIKLLKPGQKLTFNNQTIAYRGDLNHCEMVEYSSSPSFIGYPWHLFTMLDAELRKDFKRFDQSSSISIDSSNLVIGTDLYLAPGAVANAAIFNTQSGPIYIDEGAEIMEGCMIRGPFYLGKKATLKMGAKVYGATSIGRECKVGGEVSNSLIMDYSNKAHDGFLGNSVIGSWCNLGADTNCSNLKNNYSKVDIYNFLEQSFIDTGLQFCGVIMGDYSKTAINTMLNTGTVVGISSNIFCSGFPNKFIQPFSWYSDANITLYDIDKALETLKIMKSRRDLNLEPAEEHILRHIYSQISHVVE